MEQQEQRRRRGRPPVERRRVPMALRITPELSDQLVARAQATGRSITQEMELLLEQALLVEDFFAGADLGPRSMQFVTSLIDAVRQRTGAQSDAWLSDYGAFQRVEEIIGQTLTGWRPDSPVTEQDKEQAKKAVRAHIYSGATKEDVQELIRLLTKGGWPPDYREEIEDLLKETKA